MLTNKRGAQERGKKTLSAKGMLQTVRNVFEKIVIKKENPQGRGRKIDLADSLMSGLAMFSLKSPSLLAFDQARKNEIISHNLKTLYGIKQAPSDTYMREELDKVQPEAIRDCFTAIFKELQRGKLLEHYRFFDGYLMSIDGTGCFSSENVSCDDCCEKHHKDGRITYYHQMLGAAIVHPDNAQVIPLCPELISKQDGASKNDCEQRSLQRLLKAIKKEHPQLSLTLGLDGLSANAPTVNEIRSYGFNYIIGVTPGGNKALFEWIEGLDLSRVAITIERNIYTFRYINGIPLNNTKGAPNVNFLECKATEFKGKKVKNITFTWVTNHTITNDNVLMLMKGGRARWKIENETFNTLKNQGYQFEHNFGHGKKYLTSVFIFLMMLAFLIDQVQEATCGLFNAALKRSISKRALWELVRSYFYICFINSWEDLFTAISQSIGATIARNTS